MKMTTATQIVVSQFHGKREVNQVFCQTANEARKVIDEGNATAAREWRWGLSDINFIDDRGVELSIDEANEIRRACGQKEW